MKKLFIALGLLVSLTLSAQTNRWDSLKNEINFFMANDLAKAAGSKWAHGCVCCI